MSTLMQLKASAGSGKTYALAKRFLALMGDAENKNESLVCAQSAPSGFSWPEIMAATFTNKAASEMKERVIEAIKRTALEINDQKQKADWSPRKAEITLDRILRSYHRLNIRTIDSLLNLLLKVFALDAGLPPDFELIFDENEPFDQAMDTLISQCEVGDADLSVLFGRALDVLITHDRNSSGKSKPGFWLVQRLRKRLLALVVHGLTHGDDLLTDQEKMAELLLPSFDAFNLATTSLIQCIEGHGLDAKSPFTKFLAKCSPLELFDGPPSSAYAHKESLEQCIKKASWAAISPFAETCWHDFRQCYACYQYDHAVLNSAYSLAPAVEMADKIGKLMAENERESGQVLNASLPGRVRKLLSGEYGVPDAFCRLGTRLHHLLIDEFQDTSRDQWAAITPLGEECLSKGGSLFYVGDIKQAIYSWRGGDATLFDQVGTQAGLADLAEKSETGSLPCNWRSRGNIVRFNNDLFTRIARPDIASELATAMLGKAPQQEVDDFAATLTHTFADAAQEITQEKDMSGGYLRVELLPGGSVSQSDEQAVDRFEALVADELAARRPLSDICALVRKKDHAAMLCDRLVARGIPVITESSLQLKRHFIPRQLTALLAVIDYPGNDLALTELITGELFTTASGLERDTLYSWLATRLPGPLHLSFQAAFPDAWERCLAPFIRKAGLMTPYDLACDAASFFQVLTRHPEAELFLKRFLEMVHRAGEAGRASLSSFLELWDTKGDEEKVSLPDSVNAVRIMTIHKAKGLQFPVVIVPFMNWLIKSDQDLITMEVNGENVLTTLSKEMGQPYWAKRKREVLEQLNLIYVSFTRAEQELFAFLPNEASRSGPVLKALHLLLNLDLEHPLHEAGTAPPPLPGAGIPTRKPQASSDDSQTNEVELMAWLPRLRVYRHMEEAGYDARMRGEAAHRATELLQPTGDDKTDIIRARTLALYDFPVLATLPAKTRTELKADLDAMLAWMLSHDDLKPWLSSGRSEVSFLDANGALARPDFIHRGKNESVILEFKTGNADPKHALQVRRYLKLLRELEPERAVRGVVVYLDLQTLELVEG